MKYIVVFLISRIITSHSNMLLLKFWHICFLNIWSNGDRNWKQREKSKYLKIMSLYLTKIFGDSK